MKKVAVIGHFAFGKEYLDGQTVKTKVLSQVLCQRFGAEEVVQVDSHNWKKHPVGFFCKTVKAIKMSENVVILPAHNGLRVFVPLLSMVTRNSNTRLHYAVVGGWLPKVLQGKNRLQKQLKHFTGIYVETNTMKRSLNEMGFSNVEVMRNCKDLRLQQIKSPAQSQPYKLCTFSRVMREKGIEDAVNAVRKINTDSGKTVYTLDIYGPVDQGQTVWFEELQKTFPDYVRYKGTVSYDQSTDVLKDYFALLFPTLFFTEGVPGTIIDAYAAGIPVISSRWESFSDVVDEGKTGYGYDLGDGEQLRTLLESIAQDPEKVNSLREACLEKAVDFTPDRAMDVLIRQMEG